MGWTSSPSWKTKQQLIDEVFAMRRNVRLRLLDWESTRSGYSAVWEGWYGKRFIEVTLVKSFGKGGFGYKDMDTNMGPYVDDVPLKFFEMVPPANETEEKWRADQIRIQSEKKSAKEKGKKLLTTLHAGDTIFLKEGFKPECLTVSYIKARSAIALANGRLYRINPVDIEKVTPRAY